MLEENKGGAGPPAATDREDDDDTVVATRLNPQPFLCGGRSARKEAFVLSAPPGKISALTLAAALPSGASSVTVTAAAADTTWP